MAFDEKLKIDLDIFEESAIINVGSSFILTPIYHTILESERAFYLVNSMNEELKKYLPSVHANTKEAAEKILIDFLGRTAFKQSLLFCIRLKEQKYPVGYINFNTPISSTELNDWSVDFWLGPSMQGKGIMTLALHHALFHLQKYKVPRIIAVVDKDNLKSIKVLERVGFGLIEEEITGKRFIYGVAL
jgi:RimJ/RimL family protein N-acetyltransferase